MLSDTREDSPHQFLSCHWPQEFKSRRKFPRQIENEPFIEYCQFRQFPRQIENQPFIEHLKNPSDENGNDGGVEGSDACEDNSGENGESEEDESENDNEEDEDDDGVGEKENQYGDEKEENQSHQTSNKNAEAWNGRSAIRKFMEGFIGDEETLPYPDQVEKVVGFCEQGSPRESEKHVALLNDTNDGGTGPKKRPYCRPYKGPLTSQKFRNELGKQVL
jgi:hypothetical protein